MEKKSLNIYKQARKKLNLTQRDIADALNTSQGIISKIESGKVVGTYFVKYLQFLAKHKKINIRDFILELET